MPSSLLDRLPVRRPFAVQLAACLLGLAAVIATAECSAQQVIYYSPVVAAPVVPAPAYVANYTPAGNYAAVTAYSPPVVAAMPTSSVAVTSYYAPAVAAPTAVAVPMYRRGLFGRYRPAGMAVVPAY